MFAALAVLFLVVPFVELFVLLQVGQAIGVLDTIALLVLVSVVGAWGSRVLSPPGALPSGPPPRWVPPVGATRSRVGSGIGLRPMLSS